MVSVQDFVLYHICHRIYGIDGISAPRLENLPYGFACPPFGVLPCFHHRLPSVGVGEESQSVTEDVCVGEFVCEGYGKVSLKEKPERT